MDAIPTTPTQKVVSRLRSEGWVDCPGLGIPALSQCQLSDLRSFVQIQLHRSCGWMWQDDLHLSALIFSVPDHRFEVHPKLPSTLQELELDGVITFQRAKPPVLKNKTVIAVLLKNANALKLIEPHSPGQTIYRTPSIYGQFLRKNHPA
jgi:hypothetical protein